MPPSVLYVSCLPPASLSLWSDDLMRCGYLAQRCTPTSLCVKEMTPVELVASACGSRERAAKIKRVRFRPLHSMKSTPPTSLCFTCRTVKPRVRGYFIQVF